MDEKTLIPATKDFPESPTGFQKVLKADPTGDAASVVQDIQHRLNLREVNLGGSKSGTPGSKSPSDWRKEPKANFETDEAGNVKIRPDGSPKRKPFRPKQPKVGDVLADGSTYTGEDAPSRLSLPGGPGEEASQEGPPPVGEPACKVIAQGLGRVVKALKPEAQPTPDESKAFEDSLAGTFGNKHIAPLFVLVFVVGFYGLRLVLDGIASKKEQPRKAVANVAHTDGRANGNRQVPTHETGFYGN